MSFPTIASYYCLNQRFPTRGSQTPRSMQDDLKGYTKKLFLVYLYSKLIFGVHEMVARGQGVCE